MCARSLSAVVLVILAGCSSSPEARRDKYLASGKRLAANGEPRKALLEFMNAAKAMPKDAEPAYQIGCTLLELRSFQDSTAYLRRALELNPKHAGAKLRLAAMMSITGDSELQKEAERRAREVLAASAGSTEALQTLAFVEMQMGRAEDASGHLREAIDRTGGDLQSLLMLAAIKLSTGDREGGLQIVERAQPAATTPQAKVAVGRLYSLLNRHSEAEHQIRSALEQDPEYAPALSDLAAIQIRNRRPEEAEKTYARLSSHRDPKYRPLHAMFLAAHHKYEPAIRQFEKLHGNEPNNREFRRLLISAYMAAGRPGEAEKVVAAALKKNAKDVDALLQRAQMRIQAGDLNGAESDLRNVLHFEPNSAAAHLYLSRCFAARGDKSRQRQELFQALQNNPGLLNARLELAKLFIGMHDGKGAAAVLDQTPSGQRDSVSVRVQRVWAEILAGRPAEADKMITEIRRHGEPPEILLQEAYLKLQKRDLAGVRNLLERVLRQDPEETRALEILARTYASPAAGSLEPAVDVVRQHVSKYPRSARLQFFLGQWLAAAGKFADARSAYLKARQLDPVPLQADLALVQIDLAENRLDSARTRVNDLIAKHGNLAMVQFLLGNLEQTTSNYQAAIDAYRKVVAIDPNSALGLNNLAFAIAEYTHRPEDALPYAEKAKQLEPENPAVNDTLGWVYYKTGDARRAIPLLAASLAKAPLTMTRYHLAAAYARAGDSVRARALMAEVIKENPQIQQMLRKQELLVQASTAQSGATQ